MLELLPSVSGRGQSACAAVPHAIKAMMATRNTIMTGCERQAPKHFTTFIIALGIADWVMHETSSLSFDTQFARSALAQVCNKPGEARHGR